MKNLTRAVIALIFDNEGRVLLLERTKDHMLYPGQICAPGGKNNLYEGILETDEAAVNREVTEETGIRMRLFKKEDIFLADENFMITVFSCVRHVRDSEVTRAYPNAEHVGYNWYHLDNLPNGISNLTREYLDLLVVNEDALVYEWTRF